MPTVLVHPDPGDEHTPAGVPLVAWLAGAILVGLCSYFVAPELVDRLESTPHTPVVRSER
jgi:hypothetical protein